MIVQPWETHNRKCPNRRPNVAYPSGACDVCRGMATARKDALDDAIRDLQARIVRDRDEGDADGLVDGMVYACECLTKLKEETA